MDLQSKVEIRTFGEQKPGKLSDRFNHDDEVKARLEGFGLRLKAMPVLLDTPIDIYQGDNSWVQLTKRYAFAGETNPTIGTYYQVAGPVGFADVVIETIRAISRRNGFEEIGALTDRFSNLCSD